MAADPSIYGLIRPAETPNLLGMAGQAQALQAGQMQNQLAQLAFQDRERAQAADEAQRAAVRSFGTDSMANYNRLLQTGNLNAAQGYRKGVLENERYAAETAQKGVETGQKAFDQYKALLATVQSPQDAARVVTASYNDPTVGPLLQRMGTLDEGLQRLQQAISTPEGFQQWKAQAALGMDRLAQLAQTQNVNLGGQMVTQQVQPATGQVTTLREAPITESADARLSAQTSTANNIRSSAATRDVAQATRDAAAITRRGSSETELRKEFANLPEVKNYKEAIPAYQAIVQASKSNNPQADINLVYGVAKLYDPASVVREGEYNTIANSQSIPDWVKGMAQRLAGGGRLSENTKRQILEQAQIRMNSYQSEVEGAQQGYAEIARRGGLETGNVFVPIGRQIGGGGPAPAGNDPLGLRGAPRTGGADPLSLRPDPTLTRGGD